MIKNIFRILIWHDCRGQLTMAVADPRAEVGGHGDMFPVGCLEAGLLLLLFLLVSLLHLALAHLAWGQKDGVITGRYCSYKWWWEERETGGVKSEKVEVQGFWKLLLHSFSSTSHDWRDRSIS